MSGTSKEAGLRLVHSEATSAPVRGRLLLGSGTFTSDPNTRRELARAGFAIAHANGSEAFLDAIERASYDAYVIDADMVDEADPQDRPALRMIGTIRTIETYAGQKATPIILCTEDAKVAGAAAHIESMHIHQRGTSSGIAALVDMVLIAVRHDAETESSPSPSD